MIGNLDSGPYQIVVLGEPASKENSRKVARYHGRTHLIKSDKARSYAESFSYQAKRRHPLFGGHVVLGVVVYYASWRPDLDISLIKDCLQGKAYENDRYVVRHIIDRRIDRTNPRAEIMVADVADTRKVIEFVLGNRWDQEG